MANPGSFATIILADHRGVTQSEQYRSWHSFNYGQYQNPHREAPGALRVFNEDTLAGGQHISHTFDQNATVLLLPLVGGINVHFSGKSWSVEAGAVLVLPSQAAELYRIENPYAAELVSYLHIVLQGSEAVEPCLCTFDLSKNTNQLSTIFDANHQLSIGQFGGRVDVEHTLNQAGNDTFVFVIDGVFEVQNRLLHRRDALLLPAPEKLEFEALSEGAILLLLEIKKASLGMETGQSALKYD
jgi:quercetin 2,3-dioxygenase